MRRKLSRSATLGSNVNAHDLPQSSAPLALVHAADAAVDLREEDLLDFDVEADVMAIIPMPPSIPVPIRMAITRAAGKRFTFADDLDAWLHAPHEGLRGDTPFERVVAGDGMTVLVALLDGASDAEADRLIGVARAAAPRLKLVR